MAKENEVIMIQANTPPTEGGVVYWLLSKNQMEYILQDIALVPGGSTTTPIARAQYQEEVLPVLSLEKYFGLRESGGSGTYRYLVAKTAADTGGIARIIIRTAHQIRVRKLTFAASPVASTFAENNEDVLGAFSHDDTDLLIVPDIAAIRKKITI